MTVNNDFVCNETESVGRSGANVFRTKGTALQTHILIVYSKISFTPIAIRP